MLFTNLPGMIFLLVAPRTSTETSDAFQLARRSVRAVAKRMTPSKLLKCSRRPYHYSDGAGRPSPQEMDMGALQAMAIAIAVSVCVSTILVAGLMTPLRAVLRRVCPGPEGENFWTRFTVLMLYLSPLLIALVFGVPYGSVLETLDSGELAQRVLSSTLFGAFAALAGIGLRMGTLRMPPRA
jgi:hypothetical protein